MFHHRIFSIFRSPLSQGRGLKLASESDARRVYAVAPLAGAWIETRFFLEFF